MTTEQPGLFSALAIKAEVLTALDSLDYATMTPIQEQSLPAILEHVDVLAQAKTGSGKTAAFAIGILNKLDLKDYQTQALVLCPTRELADQVANESRRIARTMPNTRILTLTGGRPMLGQLTSLERAPHVVVGTPGRVLKHLHKGTLRLDGLQTLVLDEADRMLDMGFQDDIMQILAKTPKDRQTLLFSATYAEQILRISQSVQSNPRAIRIAESAVNEQTRQLFYRVAAEGKTAALIAVLEHFKPASTIVFCNLKRECQELAVDLWKKGLFALALHGDLEQLERDEILLQFANNSSSLLIATDVAARGLDIKDLCAVVNFDLASDPQMHTHRTGRTGRADKEGLAISLVSDREDFRIAAIEAYQNISITVESLTSLAGEQGVGLKPSMATLAISGGRKDKMRAGDILGALTATSELSREHIGKIDLFDKRAYVAVKREHVQQALSILASGKIKGRKFKVRKLR